MVIMEFIYTCQMLEKENDIMLSDIEYMDIHIDGKENEDTYIPIYTPINRNINLLNISTLTMFKEYNFDDMTIAEFRNRFNFKDAVIRCYAGEE